jgi:hypothetical protein
MFADDVVSCRELIHRKFFNLHIQNTRFKKSGFWGPGLLMQFLASNLVPSSLAGTFFNTQ